MTELEKNIFLAALDSMCQLTKSYGLCLTRAQLINSTLDFLDDEYPNADWAAYRL